MLKKLKNEISFFLINWEKKTLKYSPDPSLIFSRPFGIQKSSSKFVCRRDASKNSKFEVSSTESNLSPSEKAFRTSSLTRNMEPNLTKFNNDLKNSKTKRSWKSENFEIYYSVRTPKAKIELRLTKSSKKASFKLKLSFKEIYLAYYIYVSNRIFSKILKI